MFYSTDTKELKKSLKDIIEKSDIPSDKRLKRDISDEKGLDEENKSDNIDNGSPHQGKALGPEDNAPQVDSNKHIAEQLAEDTTNYNKEKLEVWN